VLTKATGTGVRARRSVSKGYTKRSSSKPGRDVGPGVAVYNREKPGGGRRKRINTTTRRLEDPVKVALGGEQNKARNGPLIWETMRIQVALGD